MILSHSKKFIYIHLEKCGGTSIEEYLMPFLEWDDILLGGTTYGWEMINLYRKRFGDDYMIKHGLYKHSTAQDIKRYAGDEIWNTYYKFATVRNPEKLVKSLYFFTQKNISQYINSIDINKKYKVIYEKNHDQEVLIQDNTIITDDLTYKSYIESMIDKTYIDGFITKIINENNRIVLPQTLRLNSSVDIYDIENINSNWQKILNNINIKSKEDLPVLFKTIDHSKIQLEEKTKSLIKEHFKIDYQTIPSITGSNW